MTLHTRGKEVMTRRIDKLDVKVFENINFGTHIIKIEK